jgi:hypothetical protein
MLRWGYVNLRLRSRRRGLPCLVIRAMLRATQRVEVVEGPETKTPTGGGMWGIDRYSPVA